MVGIASYSRNAFEATIGDYRTVVKGTELSAEHAAMVAVCRCLDLNSVAEAQLFDRATNEWRVGLDEENTAAVYVCLRLVQSVAC